MDGNSEQYFSLDAIAAQVWEMLRDGHPSADIAARLCETYHVEPSQVATDVREQVERLVRLGLIEPYAVAADDEEAALRKHSVHLREIRPHGVVPPSLWRIAWTLTWFKLLLLFQGLTATIAWIRRRVENVPVNQSASLEAVRLVEHAVAFVGAFYPGRARCLEQSLALYYLVRRQGIATRYCQGVQPYPFEAHAWVEYRGQVINDVPEHVKHFARFPDQLP
jgi:hypothetical protein